MKKTILAALLVLPVAAAAQNVTILPGGQGNLYVGLPVNLPGPLSNPVISPRIGLPAPLTPVLSASLTPSPVLAVAVPVLPVRLPTVIPVSSRVIAPSKVPALAIMTLAAAAVTPDQPGTVKAAEKLDERFDGRKGADKDAVDPRRELPPTSRGRHVSLPEQDLESEIGAY